MARRSDHSRSELRQMILTTAYRHLAERGLYGFSAAQVAKEIGYSVPTLHHVIGDHVDLVTTINTMTMRIWAEDLQRALTKTKGDRIEVLVGAYFDFARQNSNLWNAIYDLRMPYGRLIPDDQAAERGVLTEIVRAEVAAVRPDLQPDDLQDLTTSLLAIVHGHCDLMLSGTLALMGSSDPQAMALRAVRKSLREDNQ